MARGRGWKSHGACPSSWVWPKEFFGPSPKYNIKNKLHISRVIVYFALLWGISKEGREKLKGRRRSSEMTNTWLLDLPSMSQECDLCALYMPMIYLEFHVLCLHGNGRGRMLFPRRPIFILSWNTHLNLSENAWLFLDPGCCPLTLPQKQSHQSPYNGSKVTDLESCSLNNITSFFSPGSRDTFLRVLACGNKFLIIFWQDYSLHIWLHYFVSICSLSSRIWFNYCRNVTAQFGLHQPRAVSHSLRA